MVAVSVIIPTFNRSSFLPVAVESAKQAGSNLEIIVVDDGSTDDTAEVCRALTGIHYLRLPHNQGLAAARNAGIRSSSAEFVAFVDDDDRRLPGTIDLQVSALRETPEAALCYGRVLVADAKHQLLTGEIVPSRVPTGDIFWDLIEGFFLVNTSIVARREPLLECGLFRKHLRRAEDWDLWLRVTETRSVISVDQPLGIYRKATAASNQLCSDTVSLVRYMLQVQNEALQLPRAAAAPYRKRRRARVRLLKFAYDALISEVVVAVTEGNRVAARAISREALRLRPFRAPVDLTLLRLAKLYRNLTASRKRLMP